MRYSYNSPTVGLFLRWEDYLCFCEYLPECLTAELKFRERSKFDNLPKAYPVGFLNVCGNDIEINFLHYKTKDEALDKWKRRCARVNLQEVIFIYNE